MPRALGGLIIAAAIAGSGIAGSGCGDNIQLHGLTPDELLARLRALPGVTADVAPTTQTDFQYYVLHFRQPVDHSDPGQGTFLQEVSLLHRSDLVTVPMIVQTSGYADYYLDRPVELTKLLGANQVSIEHRYFGGSRPVPTDWSKLTVEQMAADEHVIITALRTIYGGAFLSTGGSKGGMTAVFHRRFYPGDVDGTVAYVAPISFGAPDDRYPDFVDTIGPTDCRQAVRNVAAELIQRRDAMLARAQLQTSHTYTRISIGPALEAAIIDLEWTFWQYFGVAQCPNVPAVTASDDELFAFLDKISPVWDSDDEQIGYFEPYYYQAEAQLGYPNPDVSYLLPYQAYSDADYANELPGPEPVFDQDTMRDISDFLEKYGDRLLFIYGQWDPWTGGKFPLGDATNSDLLTQPEGTHGAQIESLVPADRDEAFAMLEAWTGVTPISSQARRASAQRSESDANDPPPPHMPPALVRALRTQK